MAKCGKIEEAHRQKGNIWGSKKKKQVANNGTTIKFTEDFTLARLTSEDNRIS